MSHPICYLINMPGNEFNFLMDQRHQATHEYIVGLIERQEVGTWVGMLQNNHLEFTVDLAGYWTLCTLPLSYSGLLDKEKDEQFISEIHEWEQCLRKCMPSQTVIRFDNLLLDQWDIEYDYLMTRFPEAVQKFIAWLPSQDPLYWSKVPALS